VPPVVHCWPELGIGDGDRSRGSEHARDEHRDGTGVVDRRRAGRRRGERRPAHRGRGGRAVRGDVRRDGHGADPERDRTVERVRRVVSRRGL